MIIALLAERSLLCFARKRIKTVIHVNGTRGKSTIVRLIDAGLRPNTKERIYSKITGTKPAVIDTCGQIVPIKRWGKANISEQARQLIKAAFQGAEILVIECMAIQPELQNVCEDRILHADILVLSNVRNDHIPEMGNSLQEVASAFSSAFPTNGKVIAGEKQYEELFSKSAAAKNSRLVQINAGQYLDNLPGLEEWPVFLRENVALALAVCEECGVTKQAAWNGMRDYLPDPYAYKEYTLPKGTIFANALTANDPESTGKILQWLRSKEDVRERKMIILLNCRKDRPARTMEMLSWIAQQETEEIWILGMFPSQYSVKNKKVVRCRHAGELPLDQLQGDELILAVGNIGEEGYPLIHSIEERAKDNV